MGGGFDSIGLLDGILGVKQNRGSGLELENV